MSGLIEHGNGDDNLAIRVGDSNSAVSIKVYQDVYHQVTGRTEQIRKRYSENLLMEFSELEQLHYKIQQLCDVHNIVASNEIVSVFHEKERKEQFTSFDRFKAYNSNATSPSLNVFLKYNFSIVPAGLQRAQEYVVAIRLTSRVAMQRHLEEDAPPFMRGRMMAYIGGNTAEITIDYADYVIARGFVEAFDEWIQGCKKTPDNSFLKFLIGRSHVLPPTARVTAALLITWFALSAIPDFFAGSFTASTWARFLVIYSGGAFVFISMMGAAGRLIEEAIDCYPTLSYLKLNKGDSNLIDEFQEQRKWVVLKFLGGTFLAVALGILAGKLEKMI